MGDVKAQEPENVDEEWKALEAYIAKHVSEEPLEDRVRTKRILDVNLNMARVLHEQDKILIADCDCGKCKLLSVVEAKLLAIAVLRFVDVLGPMQAEQLLSGIVARVSEIVARVMTPKQGKMH